MQENCVFCKIVAGDLPLSKVYEDEMVLAFLDIHPVLAGHTLIIPKTHVENFQSADDQTLSSLIFATKKVADAVMKATDSLGFNLSTANGSAAGQEVMHLHFHIIPRKSRNELQPWRPGGYAAEQANELASKIFLNVKNDA